MGYTHKDLIELGAPELPEGYYYRVEICRTQDTEAKVEVIIRKKNRWFLDDNIASSYALYVFSTGSIIQNCQVNYMSPEKLVVLVCKKAHHKFETYLDDNNKYAKLARLAGNYKE